MRNLVLTLCLAGVASSASAWQQEVIIPVFPDDGVIEDTPLNPSTSTTTELTCNEWSHVTVDTQNNTVNTAGDLFGGWIDHRPQTLHVYIIDDGKTATVTFPSTNTYNLHLQKIDNWTSTHDYVSWDKLSRPLGLSASIKSFSTDPSDLTYTEYNRLQSREYQTHYFDCTQQ